MHRKFNVSIKSAGKVCVGVFTIMFKAGVNMNSVWFFVTAIVSERFQNDLTLSSQTEDCSSF